MVFTKTMEHLVECVPNFSEGRNIETIRDIVQAIQSVDGVTLLDQSADADHNRSVFTFVGRQIAVSEAVLRSAAVIVDRVDMCSHRGVHPRVGALDVVPFVPLKGVDLRDCVSVAVQTAQRLWDELGIPSYLYGDAAQRKDRSRLENSRRGGFERLVEALPNDVRRWPDVGGPTLHSTAGACLVGVRKLLIAYNVELATQDVRIAQKIACFVRESSGGLPAVKALGVPLSGRKRTQVSMNLTDFEKTPPHVVFETIRCEAKKLGVRIAGTELIGLIPRDALRKAPAEFRCAFRADQILENRLDKTGC